MPMYLTRFSYTPETWARLIKNPEDRRAAAKQYIESVGGKLHLSLHFSPRGSGLAPERQGRWADQSPCAMRGC